MASKQAPDWASEKVIRSVLHYLRRNFLIEICYPPKKRTVPEISLVEPSPHQRDRASRLPRALVFCPVPSLNDSRCRFVLTPASNGAPWLGAQYVSQAEAAVLPHFPSAEVTAIDHHSLGPHRHNVSHHRLIAMFHNVR